MMKFVISNDDCDKELENVAERTVALLADCVDQLGEQNANAPQAQVANTALKIETCLKILKFVRD